MADLLLVTPGFPRDEADDGCIPPMQAHVRAWQARYPGSTVRVIATQYPFHGAPYTWHGAEVFPCGGANRRWTKPLTWNKALGLGAALHRQRPIEHVHSLWLGECAWLGQRIAARVGAAHVITLMGQDARDERRWWRAVRSGRSAVAVLSDRHAGVFHHMSGRAPDAIIPWGVDPHVAAPGAVRDIELLFAGSLIPVKRPELFIALVARLLAHRPVKAVMVGARIPAGSRRVDELVRDAGLEGVIEVLGERPRCEVLGSMARSRVLVHTSAYEAQGYVFHEALLQGMSIASFAVGSAVASERWRVARDLDGLVSAVLDLLDRQPPDNALVPVHIGSTVDAYSALFQQLRTGAS